MPARRRRPRRHRPGRRAAPRQPAGRVRLIPAGFGLGALLLLAAGGLLTDTGPWYAGLRKPPLQPPGWLFAPAWTTILALTAWSGVLAWEGPGARHGLIVLAFAVNAVLHFLWTPLFFKARRPDWALREIPLLLLSIVALMAVVGQSSVLAPWLLVPYLGWVAFAIYLNRGIVRLNPGFGA